MYVEIFFLSTRAEFSFILYALRMGFDFSNIDFFFVTVFEPGFENAEMRSTVYILICI